MNTSTAGVDTLRKAGVLLALIAGLSSCQGPVLKVNFNLVTTTCDVPSADVLKGVDSLTITVYGSDLDAYKYQIANVPVANSSAAVADIPIGSARNIVVEGYSSGTSATLIARGESGPIDLKKGSPANVTIFMRPVDAFSFANSSDAPQVCTALMQGRAGHTATLLGNGKVLIAGGFSVTQDMSGKASYTYLKSTEIFDPATGTITAGPSMKLARAFHTATHLPGTNNLWGDPVTIIAGGEGPRTIGTTTDIAAISVAEVYDEATNQFVAAVPLHVTGGRTRHVALLAPTTSGGTQLLLIGGYSNGDAAMGMNPLPTGEVFNPNGPSFVDAGFKLAAGVAEEGAIEMADSRIFVTGGWTTNAANKTSYFLTATQSGGYQALPAPPLADAHVWPLLNTMGNGNMVMVAGGFNQRDPTTTDVLAGLTDGQVTTEFLGGTSTFVAAKPLTTGRGWADSISLPDGSVLAVGGEYTQISTMQTLSSGTADLIRLDPNAATPTLAAPRATAGALKQSRFLEHLTLLPDSSVLVSGGVDIGAHGIIMATRMEVYEPHYIGDNTTPHSAPQAQ